MIIPSVHLNGTSKDELLRQIENVVRVLGEAISALRQMAPNGRDYYPQGHRAVYQATDEHSDRIKRLRSVLDELESLYNAIDEQGRKT